MTTPSLFRNLVTAWQQDVAAELVDIHAAELAAGAAHGLACVGVYRADAIRYLFGLACFLGTFGLVLRQHYAPGRAWAFVFVEVTTAAPAMPGELAVREAVGAAMRPVLAEALAPLVERLEAQEREIR